MIGSRIEVRIGLGWRLREFTTSSHWNLCNYCRYRYYCHYCYFDPFTMASFCHPMTHFFMLLFYWSIFDNIWLTFIMKIRIMNNIRIKIRCFVFNYCGALSENTLVKNWVLYGQLTSVKKMWDNKLWTVITVVVSWRSSNRCALYTISHAGCNSRQINNLLPSLKYNFFKTGITLRLFHLNTKFW